MQAFPLAMNEKSVAMPVMRVRPMPVVVLHLVVGVLMAVWSMD
jgi:hypothetical protein